ncbi:MAG: hypothetical protein QM758_27350 [Armatimonas sp.]
MTISERLNKAQIFLEASDEIAARELVDSVLAEDPKNREALQLDDAIVRQSVEEAHQRLYADQADLSFVVTERGRALIIGLALVVLGIITIFYVGSQMRANPSRPVAMTAPG